jgi:20S proteasome subunit alpha 6
VKQGAVAVGATSKDFAVIGCLKRRESELASYHKKVHKIDKHCGAVVCGLIPDGAEQISFLRNTCANEKWVYQANIPINRLALALCEHNQEQTQKEGRRPTGVGLLLIGYDRKGPHLFESLPNAEYNEYTAQAIGARSQSAITFLEKNQAPYDQEANLEQLILHVVKAIRTSFEDVLNEEMISIAYVGKDTNFTILEDDKLTTYIQQVEAEMSDEMVDV